MTAETSISQAFVKLGQFLRDFCEKKNLNYTSWDIKLEECIQLAEQQNTWFVKDNVLFALKQWGKLLTKENLDNFLSIYSKDKDQAKKTVAIIMAGNIPLVGFHDFICVLLSGHKVVAKLSSNDNVLLPFIASYLSSIDTVLKERMEFTDSQLKNFDAVIATGSTNTGRYFDYYFGKHPNIIRKNRNSVAVISGEESKAELRPLGEDVFRYFGLGCRSVSKLFVPKDYDFANFYEAIFEYNAIINNNKYANNYEYNKAVYLMSNFNLRDNNFLLLKEDSGYGSPIGTLYFEYYSNVKELEVILNDNRGKLQCVVSNKGIKDTLPFGTTQLPSLNDYADGIDTMAFLLKL